MDKDFESDQEFEYAIFDDLSDDSEETEETEKTEKTKKTGKRESKSNESTTLDISSFDGKYNPKAERMKQKILNLTENFRSESPEERAARKAAKKQKKKSETGTDSSEENETNNVFSKLKGLSASKVICFVVFAIVLVISICVGAKYVNRWNKSTTVKSLSNSFPVSFTDEISKVEVVGQRIFVLSGNNLSIYDIAGKQFSDMKLSYTKPRIVSNGSRAIVFDSNGKSFMFFENGKQSSSMVYEENERIVTAAISRKGDYIIVTRNENSESFASHLYYYTKYSVEKLKWHCIDYIVSVEFLPDSKTLLCAGLTSSSTNLETNVYAFEIEKFLSDGEYVPWKEKVSSQILDCSGFSGGSAVLCFSDGRAVFSSKDGFSLSKINFSDDVTFFSTDENGYSAVITKRAVHKSDDKRILTVYSPQNEIVYTRTIESRLKSMKVKKTDVYLLTAKSLIKIENPETRTKLETFETLRNGLEIKSKYIYHYSQFILNKY